MGTKSLSLSADCTYRLHYVASKVKCNVTKSIGLPQKPDPTVVSALEKLRRVVDSRKWTQGQIADAAGVERQTINKWYKGKSTPGRNELYGALVFLSTNLKIPLSELWDDETVLKPDVGLPMYPVGIARIEIPLWGAVPAGNWEQPLDSTDMFEVDASIAGQNRVACPIVGESCSPTFLQGDVVIFKLTPHPPVGSFVLVRNGDNEATIKQLLSLPSGEYELFSPRDGSRLTASEWHAIGYAIARYRNKAGNGSYDLTVRDPQGIRPGE